jgi:hypothetical protein
MSLIKVIKFIQFYPTCFGLRASLGLQDAFNKNAGQHGRDGKWFQQKYWTHLVKIVGQREEYTLCGKFIDDNPLHTICCALYCTVSSTFILKHSELDYWYTPQYDNINT